VCRLCLALMIAGSVLTWSWHDLPCTSSEGDSGTASVSSSNHLFSKERVYQDDGIAILPEA